MQNRTPRGWDRRRLIQGMCLGGFVTCLAPRLSLATVPGDGKMVFVLLRGGVDGLAAAVPIGDPDYRRVRGAMAFERAQVTELADGFALAPGLAPLADLWHQDELAVIRAMAIPYRTRSHFDGQAVLETGLDSPDGRSDGWLNRLLQVMEGERSGIAVAAGLPRSLSGPHPALTWSPTRLGVVEGGYMERLHLLYRQDPRLYDRFEAALQLEQTADMADTMGGPPRGPGRTTGVMEATARLLSEPGGPNVAAVEFGGWDTHANQGMEDGALDRRLRELAEGLLAFRTAASSIWSRTTLVVMTEFGRTARPNGTTGTDHGTAGAGLVIGPNLARSAIVGDWPGLSDRDLYEGRDVRPTLDTRSVLKGVIAGVFDLTAGQLGRVFPDSAAAPPLADLMR